MAFAAELCGNNVTLEVATVTVSTHSSDATHVWYVSGGARQINKQNVWLRPLLETA